MFTFNVDSSFGNDRVSEAGIELEMRPGRGGKSPSYALKTSSGFVLVGNKHASEVVVEDPDDGKYRVYEVGINWPKPEKGFTHSNLRASFPGNRFDEGYLIQVRVTASRRGKTLSLGSKQGRMLLAPARSIHSGTGADQLSFVFAAFNDDSVVNVYETTDNNPKAEPVLIATVQIEAGKPWVRYHNAA